jgi:hypothetical protein
VTFMTSCKKDTNSTVNNDDMSTTADRFQEAEGTSSDVDVIADQAMEAHSVSMRTSGSNNVFGILSCAVVTNDTVNHIITVDFGSGCTGQHGHTRSGQIIIHYNGGNYFTPGFQRIVTFNNYYIDQKHLEGTRTITNNGLNSNNHLNWTIDAQNMRITRPGGSYHEWNSLRNREMIAGDSTLNNPNDDIYSITGSSNGVRSNGVTCSATITNPLIKDGSCFYRIVSGTIVITPSNKPPMTLDYGSGTCDDLATVTRNGVTYTIHIH